MAKANLTILLTILSSFTSTNAFVTPSAQRINTQLFEVDASKVQGTAVAKAAEAGEFYIAFCAYYMHNKLLYCA